jgi:phosphate-selective porin OprO and OprP
MTHGGQPVAARRDTVLGKRFLAALLLAVAAAPAVAADEKGPRDGVTVDDKGITVTAADGDVEFNLGGRLYLDTADGSTEPDIDPFPKDEEVRQARLEAELTLFGRLTGVFQYDFADENAPMKDVGVGLEIPDWVVISAGNFKEPFSMEELTSDNDIDLMERSLADTFAPARNFGGAVTTSQTNWTAALGVFGGEINNEIDEGGVSVAGRATWAPVNDKDTNRVVHFGLAANYRDPDEAGAGFDAGPESSLFAVSLVDTGGLADASGVLRFGAEAAAQWNGLRLQGEYEVAEVSRADAPDVTFRGGYVSAAYTINGTGRVYKTTDSFGTELGVFGGIDIRDDQRVSQGGFGVFEAVARFSAVDLDDGSVEGGRERNLGLGLNWYPDKNVRVMGNYIRAEADRSPAADGEDVDADIFQARLQIYF